MKGSMDLDEFVLKYKAFIFDFDGVIVDSMGIKSEAFAQLFSDLGTDVMKEVKAYHLNNGGVSRYEKFKYYYHVFYGKEITQEETKALDKKYSDLVVRKVIEAASIPGVMEFLSCIKQSAKFCCVVSATPEAEIRHIVAERGLEEFFQEVVGSPRSKKDNVRLVMEKYKLKAEQTVFFGDAKSDYDAAREHGVSFIGVVSGDSGELKTVEGFSKIKDFNAYSR